MSPSMTRSGGPIAALLWENWRRTRVTFLVILALGTVSSLNGLFVSTIKWLEGSYTQRGVDRELYVLAAWPAVFFGIWLLFSLSNPKDVTPRIPARHYALPMSSRKVALVHLLYRLALLGVLMALLMGLIQIACLTLAPADILGATAVTMAAFLCLQCLAWTIGSFGGVPFFASLVVLPVFLALIDASAGFRSASDALKSIGVPEPVFLLALFLAIGCIAIEGARLGRHVGPSMPLLSRLRLERFARRPRSEEMSPLAAQIAYEWQRKGRYLPAGTLAFVAIAGLFVFAMEEGDVHKRILALGVSLAVVPVCVLPIAAVMAGVLALLDDYRQNASGDGIFLFTRAAGSKLHSRARLIMGLKSVAYTMGACLLLMGIGIAILAIGKPQLPELIVQGINWATAFPAEVIILSVVAYALLVWTLYWMAIPGAILWLWFILVAMGYEILHRGTPSIFVPMMILPPSLAMIAATVLVVRRSARCSLLSVGTTVAALLTALVAFCIIAWTGAIASELGASSSGLDILTIVAVVLALSLCPAFPILAQPMLVERLRRG